MEEMPRSYQLSSKARDLIKSIELKDYATLSQLTLSRCWLYEAPDCLAQMPQLRSLDLSHNNLRAVPLCLEIGLDLLETLDLSHNAIQSFETEPLCHRKIRRLALNANAIKNVPEWLLHVRCLNLRSLNYSFNYVNDLSQSRFHCTCSYSLAELDLRNCCLEDVDFACIASVYTLESLDLSNGGKEKLNKFLNVAALLERPAWAVHIKVLRLAGLGIGALPEQIGDLKALIELDLSRNYLDSLPAGFAGLDSLERLDLSSNSFYYLPMFLSRLESLERLTASQNVIGSVADLLSFKKLRLLDLYDNELQACGVDLGPIEFVDLDMNYLDQLNCLDGRYEAKKSALRRLKNVEDRASGHKIASDYYESESEESERSESDCDDYSCVNYDERGGESLQDDEESWETPVSNNNEGEIVPDNNWTGALIRTPTPETRSRNVDKNFYSYLECVQLYADAD